MPDTPDKLTPAQPGDPAPDEAPDDFKSDPSDTLPVAPPNFRERLLAAQRARNNEIRPSVEIPLPGSRPRDMDSAFRILDGNRPPAPLSAADSDVQSPADAAPDPAGDMDSPTPRGE